jgi:hypothetical protein
VPQQDSFRDSLDGSPQLLKWVIERGLTVDGLYRNNGEAFRKRSPLIRAASYGWWSEQYEKCKVLLGNL